MEHILDQLSEFIDGTLPNADRLRVQSHLDGCRACRVELEDLRRVTKMVAELPKHPLPVGFMQRLERKRQTAGEAPAPQRRFFAMPMQLAAFAASGIIVCLILYRGVQDRLVKSGVMTPLSEPRNELSRFPSPPALGGLKQDIAMASPQAQIGAGPEGPASAPSAAASPQSTLRVMPGSGGSSGADAQTAPQAFTNESLQDFLEQERSRMGIKKVLPPTGNAGANASANGSGARRPKGAYQMPGYQTPAPEMQSREQARERMQQMADDFERAVQARQPPSVKLKEGSSPDLLSKDNAGFAAGSPLAFTTDTTEMVSDRAKTEMTERKSLARIAAKKMKMQQDTLPAAPAAASAVDPMAMNMPIPTNEMAPARASAGKAASRSSIGTLARNQDDLDDLWSRMATSEPKPRADFDRDMVVVVYAPHPADAALEIVSAGPSKGQLLIRYRVVPATDERRHTGFAARVIPRSDLPITYRKIPG